MTPGENRGIKAIHINHEIAIEYIIIQYNKNNYTDIEIKIL